MTSDNHGRIRYRIYHEYREVSNHELKISNGNFIDACVSEGMLNGTYDVLGIYSTMEEARQALSQYKCVATETTGFAGNHFLSCELYWFEEEEYYSDDKDSEYDFDFTGNSEFAEIETKE